MNKRIELNIDWIRIIIEKGEEIKTIPVIQHPIQYNPINIKRKYYKKSDPEYHRKPVKGSVYKPKQFLKTLKSDKIVKQEPLLDFHY